MSASGHKETEPAQRPPSDPHLDRTPDNRATAPLTPPATPASCPCAAPRLRHAPDCAEGPVPARSSPRRPPCLRLLQSPLRSDSSRQTPRPCDRTPPDPESPRLLRTHRDVNPQLSCRREKIRRLISRRRQEQQDARHAEMLQSTS